MNFDLSDMRFDLYLHHSNESTILAALKHLQTQGDALMAKFADLQADLDKLKSDVSAKLDALSQTIQALKDQIAQGTPVTQEQLDAADAEVQAIDASLNPAPPTT